jgi:anti-sigma regulatory factor (Ser/Thr protein kinase)
METFRHQALIYASKEEFLAGIIPYLQQGLEADETVLVVTKPANARAVKDALGEEASAIVWGESSGWYQRLGPMFEEFRGYLAGQAGRDRPTRVVAEGAATGRTSAWLAEYLRYEAITNIAYAPYRIPILCLWDSRDFPAPVIDAVRRTHTELIEQGRPVRNDRFQEPAAYIRHHDQTASLVSPKTVDHNLLLASPADLSPLRTAVRKAAKAIGFSDQRIADMQVAITEAATNAITHGKRPAYARGWRDNNLLVWQIEDHGTGIQQPLSGYSNPIDPTQGGVGLWVARQLSDLLQVQTAKSGTTVRLCFNDG